MIAKRYLVIDEEGNELGNYSTWADAAALTIDDPDLSVVEVDDEVVQLFDEDCGCCSWTGLICQASVTSSTSIGRHTD